MPFQKKQKPENIEVAPKTLRVFVLCGGNYVVDNGMAKTVIDKDGRPQYLPATPPKIVFLPQRTTYTTSEPDVIAALRRSGDIGKDLIELDDKGRPISPAPPKLISKTLRELKGITGVVRTTSRLETPPKREAPESAEDDLAAFDNRPEGEAESL